MKYLCCILALFAGCISAHRTVATSQPVEVEQDTAAVMAKVDTLQSEIATIKTQKTTTYGDMTLGGIAIVLMFALFIVAMFYANHAAKKHGYWRQRQYRIQTEWNRPQDWEDERCQSANASWKPSSTATSSGSSASTAESPTCSSGAPTPPSS